MTVRYRITHRTAYRYGAPVGLSINEGHLTPCDDAGQRVLAHELAITPTPVDCTTRRDWFGNVVTHFSVQGRHARLEVVATSDVEVHRVTPTDLGASAPCREVVRHVMTMCDGPAGAAREFRLDSPLARPPDDLVAWAAPILHPGRPVLEAAAALNHRIHEDLSYDPTATTVSTPLVEVFAGSRGVCQDFAHVAVAACRAHGIPARYVSGYLETTSGSSGEKLRGADASHAWFSVFEPDLGWVDFDPTNDLLPGDRHVTLAVGRDYSDVTPLKGVISPGGRAVLDIAVDVDRSAEAAPPADR